MWGKSDLTTSNCLFMLSPDNSSDRCVGCAQYSNAGSTMMLWDYGNIASGGRTSSTGIPIDITGWHHYVYIISQSGNKKQMYLDGVLKSNANYALTCSNKNLPFLIGAGTDVSGGSIRFRGKIDDVCIYNRALTANEVSLLASSNNLCFNVGIEELSSLSAGIFILLPQMVVFRIAEKYQSWLLLRFLPLTVKLSKHLLNQKFLKLKENWI
jgi:hypothetical protein